MTVTDGGYTTWQQTSLKGCRKTCSRHLPSTIATNGSKSLAGPHGWTLERSAMRIVKPINPVILMLA